MPLKDGPSPGGTLFPGLELAASGWQTARMTTDPIAVLRIELLDIEPLIWRRVEVPTSYCLQTLHRVIQATMGWLDQHLWEFVADHKTYGMPNAEDAAWGRVVYSASRITLAR